MADKNNIIFKSGPIANVNTTDIIAGQLLFAIENNTGSIYLDKDGTNRIKLNADALKLVNARTINGTSFDGTSDITTTKWGTARNIIISDNSGTYTQTNSGIDGSSNFTLKLPASITATLKGNADTATKATTADSATTATSCTGNAATASKLKTGVAINGTIFDGSSAITTAKWGTARNITIYSSDGTGAGAAVSVDGSGAISLKLPSTIKATLSGNASSATTAAACSGNAATATKLASPVAINGTNFDGSASITTANWGMERTIYISSTASTSGTPVNGSSNVSLIVPSTMTGFESISTKKIVSPSSTALNILASSTLYIGSATNTSLIFKQGDKYIARIAATTGDFQPEVTNTYNLGTSSLKWKNVYATTFTGALSGNASTATKLATARSLKISSMAGTTGTNFDGTSDVSLIIPQSVNMFTSIESDKFIVNDKVTLQYNTTNECLEFVFA